MNIDFTNLDKDKANKYLLEIFSEDEIDENSAFWQVIPLLLQDENFKDNADKELIFASKYILFENAKTNNSVGNSKQASLSVGHLSISGLDSNMMTSGGSDNITKAAEIYNSQLADPDSSIFLQYNKNNGGYCC